MSTISKLLGHEWKEKLRSPFWQKSIWVNILLGLLNLYLITVIGMMGYFADDLIREVYKDLSPINAYARLLFFYFIIELLLRFILQKIPVISILPYLTLPVKKRTLLNYPLLKSFASYFNIIGILLAFPFIFKVISPVSSPATTAAWCLTIISLVIFNNFLCFSLKKYTVKRPVIIMTLLAGITALFYLEIKGKVIISAFFEGALTSVTSQPLIAVIPLLLALLSYLLAYTVLRRNSYLEEERITSKRRSVDFSFLSRYGEAGNLIRNEMRLILRNKRPRVTVIIGLIFVLYGLIIAGSSLKENQVFTIFLGFFLTAIMSLNYGQFVYMWESSYFDAILANKITAFGYLRSKWIIFAAMNIINFILCLPYGFLFSNLWLASTALFLYNTGVTSFIMLIFGTLYRSRIDIGKSTFMNYEGTNAFQFLMIGVLLAIPYFIFLIFKIIGIPQYCYYAYLLLGIAGIVFSEYLLKLTARLLIKNKYSMAAGFRKK